MSSDQCFHLSEGATSISPSCSMKYKNFILGSALVIIYSIYSPSRYVVEFNNSSLQHVTDVVISNINMLRLVMKLMILFQIDHALVVTVYQCGI